MDYLKSIMTRGLIETSRQPLLLGLISVATVAAILQRIFKRWSQICKKWREQYDFIIGKFCCKSNVDY